MKINLEIALISTLSSLAPYFFIWFSAVHLFSPPQQLDSWKLTVSVICWSIGLVWFYIQMVGVYYFIKQKILMSAE
ncbi:hypothetical protein COO59_19850 [Mixta theicola]|uniref:Uncharacterized protein n=1 Tax=Mixta theicola TaxID=1458355 RepID=A0A2K1Q4J4_9GAMM|nr:hypothetical protein COO59_19850 [Mixta theicola]